jgi:hypothetical protein
MTNFSTRYIKLRAASVFSAIALGGFLLLAGTPRAMADERDCQRRIMRADHKLHEAAEHHGWHSPQADRARVQLRETREFCWSHYHRWWDEDAHRWHTERDWDEHDHDRR